MINFEKQFDNIESKFKEIENNLNNQIDLDTEKLIKLNKEYAELAPIVETIKQYKSDKVEARVGFEFHGVSKIRENGSKKITDHKVVDVVTFSFRLFLNFNVIKPPIQ